MNLREIGIIVGRVAATAKHEDRHRNALRAYLQTLDEERLQDLVAIMYAGRERLAPADAGRLVDMRSDSADWPGEWCIAKLLEKSSLSNYLAAGMRQARSEASCEPTLAA